MITTAQERKAVERQCAVTGETKPKAELIRFVIGPEDQLITDLKANLPGRGVWVTGKKSILLKAIKTNLFHRKFEQKVELSNELELKVEELLEKAALGRLKIANKAGEAIYGSTKLMAALEKGTIIALIHARQASPSETGKLDYRFRTNLEQSGILGDAGSKNPFNCFKTEELSLAFGAANVIHAGLKAGGAGSAAQSAMNKLVTYSAG